MTYEEVENKIQSLDEENYLLKEELQELKAELLRHKKNAAKKEIKLWFIMRLIAYSINLYLILLLPIYYY